MKVEISSDRTENWGSMSPDEYLVKFRNSVIYEYMPIEDRKLFMKNLCHWSKFPCSYVNYRQRVKDIAMRTWPKVPLNILDDKWPTDRNVAYFHTDDDDWYAPNVVEEVLPIFEAKPEIEFVTFDCMKYDVVFDREDFHPYPKTGSNAVVLRGGWPKFHTAHVFLDEYQKTNPDKVYHLAKTLCVWITHPGGFGHMTTVEISTEAFPNIKKSPPPESLMWAKEYIRDMYQLITSLKEN